MQPKELMETNSAHGYTDNELIERFYVEQGGKPHMDADLWFYESDWQMLMPVVEKIHQLGTVNMEIYLHSDEDDISGMSIFGHSESPPYINEHSNGTLQSVHKAVVEFIKWHNSQQSK